MRVQKSMFFGVGLKRFGVYKYLGVIELLFALSLKNGTYYSCCIKL